jgi:hypothetical protein
MQPSPHVSNSTRPGTKSAAKRAGAQKDSSCLAAVNAPTFGCRCGRRPSPARTLLAARWASPLCSSFRRACASRRSHKPSRIRLRQMTRRDHPILEAIGLLVLAAALVFVAPGALLTFAVEHVFRLRLDVGQRWTWAVASSVLLACAMALRSRDGLGRYALLAAVASAVVMVARFGAHSRCAAELLRAYAP